MLTHSMSCGSCREVLDVYVWTSRALEFFNWNCQQFRELRNESRSKLRRSNLWHEMASPMVQLNLPKRSSADWSVEHDRWWTVNDVHDLRWVSAHFWPNFSVHNMNFIFFIFSGDQVPISWPKRDLHRHHETTEDLLSKISIKSQ